MKPHSRRAEFFALPSVASNRLSAVASRYRPTEENWRPEAATSQRPQYRPQIHNRLVFANSIAALCQQACLNRRQVIKVEHLLGDRVDQHLAKLEEERQGLYLGPRQGMLFPVSN